MKSSIKKAKIIAFCFLFGMGFSIQVYAQPEFSKLSAKQRIAIAEKEQVEAATDSDFQENMDKGHELFKTKHYLKAIRAYEEAQRKRPNNVYPKVKITDIELSMKDTLDLLREAEKQEMAEIPEPQKPEISNNPDDIEESPEERLKKINDWEKQERAKLEREREREQKKPEAIKGHEGDVPKISLEEYQKELAQKYPGGITEETFTEGNKTITRRVVVTEGKGNEYKKVEHNWGGVFFFKNGDAVTERVWKGETEK